MTQLKTMLKWDFTLQYRYKIIHLSIASVIAYFLAIKAVPFVNAGPFRSMFLFFDPITIGIVFVGALVLFEKTEGTLHALSVTPMKLRNYFLSKIISLTALSVASALLFTFLVHGLEFNYLYMLLGIVPATVLFILLGFILVSRCNSLNEYMLSMGLAFLVMFIPPVLYTLGIFDSVVFYLWPSHASFVLLEGVFTEGAVTLYEAVYAVGYLTAWIIASYLLAKRAFYRNIIMGGQ